MTVVVDSSVVLRWFTDQEPGIVEAARWLERWTEDASLLVAPDILRFEVLGGLARLQQAKDTGWAARAFGRFERLGLRLIPTDTEVALLALRRSQELRVGGWDAVYLAHAESLGIAWLTADQRILRRLPGDRRLEALIQ